MIASYKNKYYKATNCPNCIHQIQLITSAPMESSILKQGLYYTTVKRENCEFLVRVSIKGRLKEGKHTYNILQEKKQCFLITTEPHCVKPFKLQQQGPYYWKAIPQSDLLDYISNSKHTIFSSVTQTLTDCSNGEVHVQDAKENPDICMLKLALGA